MEIYDSILDYIYGNKDALRNIITMFLNVVMLEEAKQQSCSDPMNAHPKEHLTAMDFANAL